MLHYYFLNLYIRHLSDHKHVLIDLLFLFLSITRNSVNCAILMTTKTTTLVMCCICNRVERAVCCDACHAPFCAHCFQLCAMMQQSREFCKTGKSIDDGYIEWTSTYVLCHACSHAGIHISTLKKLSEIDTLLQRRQLFIY